MRPIVARLRRAATRESAHVAKRLAAHPNRHIVRDACLARNFRFSIDSDARSYESRAKAQVGFFTREPSERERGKRRRKQRRHDGKTKTLCTKPDSEDAMREGGLLAPVHRHASRDALRALDIASHIRHASHTDLMRNVFVLVCNAPGHNAVKAFLLHAGASFRTIRSVERNLMDISNQIKKRRTDMGLSQEELAERIYVSRQTISNWETDKTYPDIQSLLMLSVLFDTTIDVLVKGDLEVMEKTVASADAKKMRILGIGMFVLLVLMIPFALAGITLWGPLGVLLGLAPWAASMAVAVVIERMKIENDVQTYREILAFAKGEAVDRSARTDRTMARQRKLKAAYGEKPLWKALVRGLGIGIVAVALGAIAGYASAMLFDIALPL